MVRRFGFTEVQTALNTLLTSNLSYRVFDYVPQKQEYPFIVIGDDWSDESYMQDKTNEARSFEAKIHIWSKKKGYKECNRIAQEILALLPSISISNFNVIDYSYEARKMKSAGTRRVIMEIDFELDQIS